MSNKKWTVLMISVLLTMFVAAVPNTLGATDDDLLVTMSGAYLEVNIINASWDIGTVEMNTSYWTNETGKTQIADVYNCTQGTNIDFEMVIESNPAIWFTVWAENYTTGADQFKINATNGTWATQVALNLTTYADIAFNHDPATNVSFDLRFDSPTTTTTGALQTVTLNGKISVH